MRQVAVTESDKVEAQIKFGWSVNGYGVGDLVAHVNAVSEADLNRLLDEYAEKYDIVKEGGGFDSYRRSTSNSIFFRSKDGANVRLRRDDWH